MLICLLYSKNPTFENCLNKSGLKICLFVNISTNVHPQCMKKLSTLSGDSHADNTCSNLGCVALISHNTKLYARNSLLVLSTHGVIYKN